jgi:hypothetical protein
MVIFALAVIAIARLYQEGAMGLAKQLAQRISKRKQSWEGLT